MITVVIVEDLIAHQEFLKTILKDNESINCLSVIGTANEALFRIPDLKPDIVLIDLGLPDMDGVACLQQLVSLCPETKFMALTVHQDDAHIFEALKAGAKGYVLKRSKPYQIIDAISDLYNGGAPISSEIALKIINSLPERKRKVSDEELGITKRENEILEYLAQGLTYGEVAEKIFISVNTLKSHIYRIYGKLNADNRTEALNNYFGK